MLFVLPIVLFMLTLVYCITFSIHVPLFLHLMYTDVQITPTTADIISADTAQTVPYTVESVYTYLCHVCNSHICACSQFK